MPRRSHDFFLSGMVPAQKIIMVRDDQQNQTPEVPSRLSFLPMPSLKYAETLTLANKSDFKKRKSEDEKELEGTV